LPYFIDHAQVRHIHYRLYYFAIHVLNTAKSEIRKRLRWPSTVNRSLSNIC